MTFIKLILLIMMTQGIKAKTLMIAHAGGAINGMNYTNSIQALNENYAKGFRYFELDFSWTSDGQLVCLHDWGKRFKKIFGYKIKQALSLKEFQKASMAITIQPCTAAILNQWLATNSDAKIITDVKYDSIKAIKKLIQDYPKMANQLIPQFYQPDEYITLKEMGFKQVIWILYQYEGSAKLVVEYSKGIDLLAVSMRAAQAKKKKYQKLIENGTNIFVYTINKQSKKNKLVNDYAVSGIYTDFLEIKSSMHN